MLRHDAPSIAPGGATGSGIRRRTIHATDGLILEDSARPADQPIGRGFSPQDQIVLPYHGVFLWQVGRMGRLVDPNVVLFVRGGEEFFEAHPFEHLGHGSAIITLDGAIRGEIGARATADECVIATRPMPDSIRLATHALLFDPHIQPLEREERLANILRTVVGNVHVDRDLPKRAIVERAKAVLHDHADEVLSLGLVADMVGVTPIYLTQAFRRSEGMPLYRYQMRLRLARALVELPRSESLTDLALTLGFSSHSHFTTTFRAAFGLTPSAFRASAGRRQIH
ncbi:MAG: helix-turn-helix transcriptional regulator [Sphingomonas sp.]